MVKQGQWWHSELILDYLAREGLTDEQGDQMLDAGRIEMGFVSWDSKANVYIFRTRHPDDTFTDYSVDLCRQIAE